MRLFVHECKNCSNRVYLNITAFDRGHLAERIGGRRFQVQCPHCKEYVYYSVDAVFAKQDIPTTPAGAIIGGAVGLIAGPLGMLVGGALGTLWGANADQIQKRTVNRFNRSR